MPTGRKSLHQNNLHRGRHQQLPGHRSRGRTLGSNGTCRQGHTGRSHLAVYHLAACSASPPGRASCSQAYSAPNSACHFFQIRSTSRSYPSQKSGGVPGLLLLPDLTPFLHQPPLPASSPTQSCLCLQPAAFTWLPHPLHGPVRQPPGRPPRHLSLTWAPFCSQYAFPPSKCKSDHGTSLFRILEDPSAVRANSKLRLKNKAVQALPLPRRPVPPAYPLAPAPALHFNHYLSVPGCSTRLWL